MISKNHFRIALVFLHSACTAGPTLVTRLVDVPSEAFEDQALAPVRTAIRAVDGNDKEVSTQGLYSGKREQELALYESDTLVSVSALGGSRTSDEGPSAIDATFSNLVITRAGVYRLGVRCSGCAEWAISEPIVVKPLYRLGGFLSCSFTPAGANIYGGGGQSVSDVDPHRKTFVDDPCITTISAQKSLGPSHSFVSKSIGAATCSGSAVAVSCVSNNSICAADQPGGSAIPGEQLTLSWNAGDVPAGSVSVLAGSAVEVSALPTSASRAVPLSTVISGGFPGTEVQLTLDGSNGDGDSVSSTCSFPADSSDLTIPVSVLSHFAAGTARWAVFNGSSANVLLPGDYDVKAWINLPVTGAWSGTIDLD